MTRRRVHSSFPISLLAVVGALAGCSDGSIVIDAAPPDDDAAVIPAAMVELGTGTVEFEPIADDDELIIHAGPQGGHHFLVHARIQNLLPGDWERPSQPENPITRFTAFNESGDKVDLGLPPYALGYRDRGDQWRYLPSGRFLHMLDARVPELIGTRVRIRVEVTDMNGETASDERWVMAASEAPVVDAGVPDPPPADAGP